MSVESDLLWIPALLGGALLLLLLLRSRSALRAGRSRDRKETERLRMLIATSPEGIWRVDPRGFTMEVNRSMADMLGLAPQDLVGRSFRDFVPPESRTVAEDAFAKGLAGRPVQFETTVLRSDGSRLHVLITTHPILDAKGSFVEGFGIVRDITARHRVEIERHHALSLLEAALESTADGLLIVDREGRIVRYNQRFVQMWQIPAEILQGHDDERALAFVLSQLNEPEHFLSKVRKLYATPEAESFDTLHFRDGRVFERYSLPQRLDGSVVGRVWSFHDVTDRERAQTEHRLSMEREASIALNLDAALFTLAFDPDGRVLKYEYVSRGAEAVYGVAARDMDEDPNFWFHRVQPDDFANIVVPAREKLLRLQTVSMEVRYETSKGIWRWHRVRLTPRLESDGNIHVDGIETDVTDRVLLEEQFRHAQKMEAVGQLAGGVAHDFNNILTAVLGYADLLLARMPRSDSSRPAVEEIRKGAERAAALTRQLLAFSRRAATQPRVIDLNAAIRDLEPMVRRLAGEDIEFRIDLSEQAGCVRLDPVQLEQVIVNLVVNSRDAMPRGGSISIRTDRFGSGGPEGPGLESSEGALARLRVADTGVGIPPSVLEHIFEPFFTTKEPGRGTGLGLATVYGIVRQHGGRIRAVSEPGRGAEIEIVFPGLDPLHPRPEPEPTPGGLPTGDETVLLVEDDPSLLLLARDALSELGYRVLAASSGVEALQHLERAAEKPRILVTDVVMPAMGGRELAERAQRIRPGLPTLFVSGYTRDPALDQGAEDESVHFLVKPYTSLSLARKLREILDASGALAAGSSHGAG